MNTSKNHIKQRNTSEGFTIVELMVATIVFSLALLVAVQGILVISRNYYRGVTQANTQEAARSLLDEITSTIKFTGDPIRYYGPTDSMDNPVTGPDIPYDPADLNLSVGHLCIGTKKYSFAIDRVVKELSGLELDKKEAVNAIISERQASCDDNLTFSVIDTEVDNVIQTTYLGENMRLTKFSVEPVNNNELDSGLELWRVSISLAYGDTDVLRYTDDNGADRVVCESDLNIKFCAITELSTVVGRRIAI